MIKQKIRLKGKGSSKGLGLKNKTQEERLHKQNKALREVHIGPG